MKQHNGTTFTDLDHAVDRALAKAGIHGKVEAIAESGLSAELLSGVQCETGQQGVDEPATPQISPLWKIACQLAAANSDRLLQEDRQRRIFQSLIRLRYFCREGLPLLASSEFECLMRALSVTGEVARA